MANSWRICPLSTPATWTAAAPGRDTSSNPITGPDSGARSGRPLRKPELKRRSILHATARPTPKKGMRITNPRFLLIAPLPSSASTQCDAVPFHCAANQIRKTPSPQNLFMESIKRSEVNQVFATRFRTLSHILDLRSLLRCATEAKPPPLQANFRGIPKTLREQGSRLRKPGKSPALRRSLPCRRFVTPHQNLREQGSLLRKPGGTPIP